MIQGLFILVLMLGTFLLPNAAAVALDESAAYGNELAIAPSVVRQGDFAVQLARSLNLSNVESEDEAVRTLATLGIEPAGGWMTDYPMTPEIVVELRNAVAAAVAAVRLDLNQDAAMRAFIDLVAGFGLPLPADMAPTYADGGAPSVYGPDCSGTALEDYYVGYGMPLYSYCPPPPTFLYLYSWVPCDFRRHGQVFTGFFIQRHIDRIPPHTRYANRHPRFADDHTGDKHDRDSELHQRVSGDTTPPPGRQRFIPVDSRRYAATNSGDNRENHRRSPPASGAPQSVTIIGAGAVVSSVTSGAVIVRPARHHDVRDDVRPADNHDRTSKLAPMAPHGASAQSPTGHAHNSAPSRAASGPVPARVSIVPAPMPAPSVVAPVAPLDQRPGTSSFSRGGSARWRLGSSQ